MVVVVVYFQCGSCGFLVTVVVVIDFGYGSYGLVVVVAMVVDIGYGFGCGSGLWLWL